MEKSPWKKRGTRKNYALATALNFLKGVLRRRGLATTTASGHEVQGRELAEDRHVEVLVYTTGAKRPATQAFSR